MSTAREKRIEIVSMAESLHREDRIAVLRVLLHHTTSVHIIENADGCRINLDHLPDSLVMKIHHIMTTRLATHRFDMAPPSLEGPPTRG